MGFLGKAYHIARLLTLCPEAVCNAISLVAPGFPVELSYKEWALRIDNSFEENFWIPEEPTVKNQQDEEAKLVHRRGIYKDTVDASHRFADYQFRPNLCVAMAVVSIFVNK